MLAGIFHKGSLIIRVQVQDRDVPEMIMMEILLRAAIIGLPTNKAHGTITQTEATMI
jgi:hypothetical protein